MPTWVKAKTSVTDFRHLDHLSGLEYDLRKYSICTNLLYLRTVQRSVFVSVVSLPRTVSVNGDEVWIVGKPPLLLHSKDGFLACLAAFVTIQLFGMQGSCKDHARLVSHT